MKMLAIEMEPGTWETAVVSVEIVCAMAAALWMMHRKVSRDVLVLGGDYPTLVALSPLMQPRGWWSLPALLVFRVAAVAFYVVVQLYDVYRTNAKCMIFYTSWNFVLQGVYFTLAAKRTYALYAHELTHPAAYAALVDENINFLRRSNTASGGGARRRGWLRLDLVLDVCLATAILISAVVWTILFPYAEKTGHPELLLNWTSYCQHAINLVVLQVDFAATHHSVSVDSLPFMVAWPTSYCVFAWIIHGTIKHGFWPYPFLKLDTPWAPFWYGGLLFAHLVTFVGMLALSKLKRWRREATHSAVPGYESDLLFANHADGDDDLSDEPYSPKAVDPHSRF